MQCPYCKEEVLEGAVKCKHCGSGIGTIDDRTTAIKTKASGFLLSALNIGTRLDNRVNKSLRAAGFEQAADVGEAVTGLRSMAINKLAEKLDMNQPGTGTKAEVQSDDKKCPFCAELIKREAVFCRYCKKDLN